MFSFEIISNCSLLFRRHQPFPGPASQWFGVAPSPAPAGGQSAASHTADDPAAWRPSHSPTRGDITAAATTTSHDDVTAPAYHAPCHSTDCVTAAGGVGATMAPRTATTTGFDNYDHHAPGLGAGATPRPGTAGRTSVGTPLHRKPSPGPTTHFTPAPAATAAVLPDVDQPAGIATISTADTRWPDSGAPTHVTATAVCAEPAATPSAGAGTTGL